MSDTLDLPSIGEPGPGYASKVNEALEALRLRLPRLYIEDFGADPVSGDNTAAIQAAIDAAAALPQGVVACRRPAAGSTTTFSCAGTLTWAEGVTFEVDGPRANYVRLDYTGTGARFIDARNLTRVGWKGVRFSCSGVGFAGILVDLAGATFWNFEKCEWGNGTGSVAGSGIIGVSFTSGHSGSFRDYRFDRMDIAVDGGGNGVEFLSGYFTDGGTTYIRGAGTSWTFIRPTIEPLIDGTAGFIKYVSAGSGGGNVTVIGAWASDVETTGGAWFSWWGDRGLTVIGGMFSTEDDTTFFKATDAVGPVSVFGTRFASPTTGAGPGPIFDYTNGTGISSDPATLVGPHWTDSGTPSIFKTDVVPAFSQWTDASNLREVRNLYGGFASRFSAQSDNYTLVLADAGKVVEVDAASGKTVTIPANADVAFPTGTRIDVYQAGAGQVTVSPAGGVTLRAPNGAKTALQYSIVHLLKRSSGTWILSGDSTA